jgi:hypothetical protein
LPAVVHALDLSGFCVAGRFLHASSAGTFWPTGGITRDMQISSRRATKVAFETGNALVALLDRRINMIAPGLVSPRI